MEYKLRVSGLDDCSGNRIDSVLIFRTPAAPVPPPERPDTARILITEIFADPSPEVGLPLAEFIEIYNSGIDTIDLNAWQLSDGTSKGIIRNTRIAPDEYLILCPAADTLEYGLHGRAVGVSP